VNEEHCPLGKQINPNNPYKNTQQFPHSREAALKREQEQRELNNADIRITPVSGMPPNAPDPGPKLSHL